MKCPECGQEMVDGYLYASCARAWRVSWCEASVTGRRKMDLSRSGFINPKKGLKGHRCTQCHMVLAHYDAEIDEKP